MIKWPEKKYCVSHRNNEGWFVAQKGKTCESCWAYRSYNDGIAACQAAVEAAGLEYGLDEEKMGKIVAENWNAFCSPHYLTHAIKLAERELITRIEAEKNGR